MTHQMEISMPKSGNNKNACSCPAHVGSKINKQGLHMGSCDCTCTRCDNGSHCGIKDKGCYFYAK